MSNSVKIKNNLILSSIQHSLKIDFTVSVNIRTHNIDNKLIIVHFSLISFAMLNGTLSKLNSQLIFISYSGMTCFLDNSFIFPIKHEIQAH